MRVTNMMSSMMMTGNLRSTMDRMLTLQNQASSGLRITRASDDPSGTNQDLNLRSTVAGIEQYTRNVGQAKTQLALIDSSLGNISKALQEANRLGLAGANASTDNAQRQSLAMQVQQQIDGIVREVNVTYLNRHIFGGYRTEDTPVTANPTGVPPYVYNGDDGTMRVMVSESTEIEVSLTAKDVLNLGNGSDAVRPDILETLSDLKTALGTGDTPAITDSLKRLEKGMQQVVSERGKMGARAMQVDIHSSHLAETKVTMSAWLSDVENVDVAETLTRLQSEQNAYQAALIAMGRMAQPSLADYLK